MKPQVKTMKGRQNNNNSKKEKGVTIKVVYNVD